jgi:methionyl-tRNA formyltransferase
MALRVLYFGTPAFAVPSLLALVRSRHEVVGVVTQPDRPRGRGHKVQIEAVKAAALEHGLPVWQPERLKDPAFLERMRGQRADLAVVAAYGRLLPQSLLDIPRHGFVNVHASLLPRWRGAAPIHRAILAGDEITGVTIMRVVLALDAGPMLARQATPIGPDETSAELEVRLAAIGAAALLPVLDQIETGPVPETAQDDRDAVHAPKIERGDSPIVWTATATGVHNTIRGLHPWPLASAILAGRRLLVLRSRVDDRDVPEAAAGTIVRADAGGLRVATGSGHVRLLEVQPEGRRAMAVRDFLNGARVEAGTRFE